MNTENERAAERLRELPILPLRNTVAFPYSIMPLLVGIPKSVKLVDEALKGAVASIKKTWYKPETHKNKVAEAIATAKKAWDKDMKDLAEKKKKEDVKLAERTKAISAAGFVMTDYRKGVVSKMAIDEAGDKDFVAFLADLKKTKVKATTASTGKGFKPDMAAGGKKASINLAI